MKRFPAGHEGPSRRHGVLPLVLLMAVSFVAASGSDASALGLGGILSPSSPAQAAPVDTAPPPLADSAIPAGSGEGRRVVYSTAQQRVWLVEQDGSLSGTWLVSGRTGIPYDGAYTVFSRSPWSSARNGRVVMQHMVRFARTTGLPIGFHAIPVGRRSGTPLQSEAELGQPRSAGCVRQRPADAAVMWDFAQIGTPVIVISH